MIAQSVKRRDPTLLLALVAALAVHALILHAGNEAYRQNLGWQLASSLARAKPEDLVPVKIPRDADVQLGEPHGTGKSVNSVAGETPMESAVKDAEQEQAMASRDPTGFGKAAAAAPLVRALQGDTAARSASPAAPSELTSPPAPRSSKAPPLVLVDPKAPQNLAAAENPLSAGPLAAKPTPPQASQQPQQQPQKPSPSETPTQELQNPSQAAPGGKPEPQENYESVPVTLIASRYVGGRIEARTGRKFLTRELPDITLAGYIDMEGMERCIVGLRLKIDETGNVVDVKTVHSSGSASIDLPCERAAATWWFEPKRDPVTGKPVPDVIDFAIVFK
ncbi:MAG: hypothetical protein ABSF29_05110 [Tepidisphaeraceae bacterium]|jgi:hypothetical protein